ncbi:MAG: hydroxymethylbilane synthase [Bacteroidota bacterium]
MAERDRTIIIGSRGSELALWQSNWVKSELERLSRGITVTLTIIKTTGDKILDSPLSKIGDKGLFTKELEHALLANEIDLAVHSLKDVPTQIPAGLTIGAITARADVRDIFLSHPAKNYTQFSEVPNGAKIATGSLRRKCQLLSWRPDLEIIDIRGNLNSRLAKLDASDWDGMILAQAGVHRLGWEKRITEILPTNKILPAVGQGALAIELRESDRWVLNQVRKLASYATEVSTKGERAFLRFLEGGCQVPIGAYGRIEDNVFYLDALIGSLDGKKIVRGATHGNPDASELLGTQLAETLYRSGGKEILEHVRSTGL